MPTVMRYVKYICSNEDCLAEDTDKLFSNETPVPVINCWKCHAGMKLSVEESLMRRKGMFLQVEEESRGKKNISRSSA